MSEDYWFPWFPFLYENDTLTLTPEEDGIYRRMIDHYMKSKKPLPNNDVSLARICGLDMANPSHSHSLATAKGMFQLHDDDCLHLKRCDETLRDQAKRKAERSKSGKKGAQKRWNNQDDNSSANSSANGYGLANDATKTKTDTYSEEDSLHSSSSSSAANDVILQRLAQPKQKKTYRIDFSFQTFKFSGITEADIKHWEQSYPALNVIAQLHKMTSWLKANPKNRKSNYEKFINGWLSREQDSAPRVKSSGHALSPHDNMRNAWAGLAEKPPQQ